MKIQYQHLRLNRSTKVLIEHAEVILNQSRARGFNMTLRQLYYKFVSRGLFTKEHPDITGTMTINHLNNYKMLGEAMASARMGGMIDWAHLEDRSRNVVNWHYENSVASAIQSARDHFEIDHWTDQPTQVEVWVEKHGLEDMMKSICGKWGVPVFACRGYGSVGAKHDAWERILDRWDLDEQTTRILYFGDHDPSGIDMVRDIKESMDVFQSRENHDIIEVNKLALSMEQIRRIKPVPQPNKKSDPREKWYTDKYGPQCWELDALDYDDFVKLVEADLMKTIDHDKWAIKDEELAGLRAEFDVAIKLLDEKEIALDFLDKREEIKEGLRLLEQKRARKPRAPRKRAAKKAAKKSTRKKK